jgi:hypothetical protein
MICIIVRQCVCSEQCNAPEAIMEAFAIQRAFSVPVHGMRRLFILGLLAWCPFIGAAHAMSCMIHESEGKALLCYHKSADGRCLQFGPACQTKVMHPPEPKPIKPISAQAASHTLKK